MSQELNATDEVTTQPDGAAGGGSFDREREGFALNHLLDRLAEMAVQNDRLFRDFQASVACLLLTTGDITVSKETAAVARDAQVDITTNDDGSVTFSLVEGD